MITFAVKLNNFGSSWFWNDLFGSKCHIPMFKSPEFLGSMLPQYMALSVSQLVSLSNKFRPLISKVGG